MMLVPRVMYFLTKDGPIVRRPPRRISIALRYRNRLKHTPNNQELKSILWQFVPEWVVESMLEMARMEMELSSIGANAVIVNITDPMI